MTDLVSNPGGRPPINRETVLQKLRAAFQNGWTDEKACQYAKISPSTFYSYMQKDQEFMEEVTSAKNFWLALAGKNITEILQSIDKSPRILRLKFEISKWVYEKQMPEVYSIKDIQINNNINNQPNYTYLTDQQIRELSEAISQLDPVELAKM